ncbi:MAG TPA: hypothetical protein DDW20_04935 [Firmicutes bacterium]|nr:hypothetical protein [Bacillota bacterium]
MLIILGNNWMNDVQIANDVRESCKSILYMVCYSQIQTEEAPAIVDVVRNEPVWLLAVVGINLFLLDGILVLTYFAFIKKGKEKDIKPTKEKQD